jgi:glycosyltransferase involved in cell wall biosynthesis
MVTVVRNGGPTLERALASVLGQSYAPIEYIIVDGASTDGTIEVIRRFEHRLALWISEPDQGISEAFNKGIAASSGELIGLLNADDWMEPEQVAHAVAALEASGADFVFGDLAVHDASGEVSHRIRGDADYARRLATGMPAVSHPTVLARRSAYERIGLFDLRCRVAMDYDWLLRAERAGCRGVYAPEVVAHMSLGGVSDERYLRALAEVRDISRRHGVPAAAAFARFGYRVVKGRLQRALKRLAPRPLYDFLRRRVNRSYEPSRPRNDPWLTRRTPKDRPPLRGR